MVIVGIEKVQKKSGVVFLMDLFEPSEEHGVKDGIRLLLCDVTQKETAVVKEKVAAFERFFVPQDRNGKSPFAEIIGSCGGDLVDSFSQAHGGGKLPVAPFGRDSVDGDFRLGIGKAFDLDLKVISSLDAAVTVDNGSVTQICDLKHFLSLSFYC